MYYIFDQAFMVVVLEPIHTSTLARFSPVWHNKILNVNAPFDQTELNPKPAQLTQPSWHGTVWLLLEQCIKILF